jgi:hypothetical protein
MFASSAVSKAQVINGRQNAIANGEIIIRRVRVRRARAQGAYS